MAIPIRMSVQRWKEILNALDDVPEHQTLRDIISEELTMVGYANVTVPILLTAAQRRVINNIIHRG